MARKTKRMEKGEEAGQAARIAARGGAEALAFGTTAGALLLGAIATKAAEISEREAAASAKPDDPGEDAVRPDGGPAAIEARTQPTLTADAGASARSGMQAQAGAEAGTEGVRADLALDGNSGFVTSMPSTAGGEAQETGHETGAAPGPTSAEAQGQARGAGTAQAEASGGEQRLSTSASDVSATGAVTGTSGAPPSPSAFAENLGERIAESLNGLFENLRAPQGTEDLAQRIAEEIAGTAVRITQEVISATQDLAGDATAIGTAALGGSAGATASLLDELPGSILGGSGENTGDGGLLTRLFGDDGGILPATLPHTPEGLAEANPIPGPVLAEELLPIALPEIAAAVSESVPLVLGFSGQSYVEGVDHHEGGLSSLTHGLV